MEHLVIANFGLYMGDSEARKAVESQDAIQNWYHTWQSQLGSLYHLDIRSYV